MKLLFVVFLALLSLLVFIQIDLSAAQSSYFIETAAGGLLGASNPTNTPLKQPYDIFLTSTGELYIADTEDNRIRKISSNGMITTVAGNGQKGFTDDGEVATRASLFEPSAVGLSTAGEVYFIERGANRLRKIFNNGTIGTVAGTGEYGFSGDGGLATRAKLANPCYFVITNTSEIFMTDNGNKRISKITNTGIISTFFSTALNYPNGIDVASNGDVYVSDTFNVRKISHRFMTNFAGNGAMGSGGDGGPATSASIGSPSDVTVSPSGDVFFGDILNGRVRKVSTNGIISTIAGNGDSVFSGDGGPATSASLSLPESVAVSANGEVYIADDNRVRKIDKNGIITTIAGNGERDFGGDGGMATGAALRNPSGLAMSSHGELLIADYSNNKVRFVASNGTISSLDSFGTSYPNAVMFFNGDVYYVGDHWVRKLSNGLGIAGRMHIAGFSGDGGLATNALFNNPKSIAASSLGEIYIADSGNHRIRKISTKGIVTTIAGTGNATFAGDGDLALNASLNNPSSIFILNDEIYIADTDNNRIRKIFTNGTITTIAGNENAAFSGDGGPATSASLNHPRGLFVTPSGEIYISDTNNNRLRKVQTDGTITTLGGSGEASFRGDGDLALKAAINQPVGIVVSPSGSEIYFSDYNNDRVRVLYFQCFNKSREDQCGGNLGGSCTNSNVCTCLPNYSGNECEWTTCFGRANNDTLACSGNGNCTAFNQCKCDEHHTGANCELAICYGKSGDNSCNGRGNCVDWNQCVCNSNYFGNECQLTTCEGLMSNDSSVCSQRGNCSDFNTCKCRSQYFGDNCELTTCFGIPSNNSQTCSSHGTCIDKNTCSCEPNYYGSSCNVTQCFGIWGNMSSVCSGHGRCTSENQCTCKEGYSGSSCQDFDCSGIPHTASNVCSGNGQCIDINQCACATGWNGANCNETTCYGLRNTNTSVCSGHGTCISNNNCTCERGYHGSKCESFNCLGDGSLCPYNGYCSTMTDTCKCTGYLGDRCEIPVCFGLTNDYTSVCRGHGTCIDKDTCKCNKDWFGKDCQYTTCFGVPGNSSLVCSQRGSCTALNTCSCSQSVGLNCELNVCFGKKENDTLVCSSRGVCDGYNHCTCRGGFTGTQCEYSNTAKSVSVAQSVRLNQATQMSQQHWTMLFVFSVLVMNLFN